MLSANEEALTPHSIKAIFMTDPRILSVANPATAKLTRHTKSRPASPSASGAFEDMGFFHTAPTDVSSHETMTSEELYAANPFIKLRYLLERLVGDLKEDLRRRFALTKNQVLYFEYNVQRLNLQGYAEIHTQYTDEHSFELILDNLVQRQLISAQARDYYCNKQYHLAKALAEVKVMQQLYASQPKNYEILLNQVQQRIATLGNGFPHVKKILKQLDAVSPQKLSSDIKFLDEQIAHRQHAVPTPQTAPQHDNTLHVLKREKLNSEIKLLRLECSFESDQKKQDEVDAKIHNKKIERAQLQLQIATLEKHQIEAHIQIMLEEPYSKATKAQAKLENLIKQEKQHVWAEWVKPVVDLFDQLKNIPAGLQQNFAPHHLDARPIDAQTFGVTKSTTLSYLRSLVDIHNAIHAWLKANNPGFFANLFGWYTPEYSAMLTLSKQMYGFLEKQKKSDYYAYLRAPLHTPLEHMPFKKAELVRCQLEVRQTQQQLMQEQAHLLRPFKRAIASRERQLEQLRTEATSPPSIISISPDTPPRATVG
jgi:hypothetical protein